MTKPVILCVDDEKLVLESLKRQLKYRCLDKPWSKEELVETIQSALAKTNHD